MVSHSSPEIATEVNGGRTGMKTSMKAGMKTADAIVVTPSTGAGRNGDCNV